MFFIIYQTTHRDSGSYYIGAHRAKKLDDGYLGSGNLIKAAIEKYGKEAFDKKILFVFSDPESMWKKESEIVTEQLLCDPLCYNLKIGGEGGIGNVPWNKGKQLYKETKEKISKKLVGRKHDSEVIIKRAKSNTGKRRETETKEKISRANAGKIRTEETKRKLSEAAKRRTIHGNTGKKNKIVTCPHCEKSGGSGVMRRWHFDRCASGKAP